MFTSRRPQAFYRFNREHLLDGTSYCFMGVSLLFLCILAERGQVKAACPFPMNRGHLSIIYQCVYCLHQQPNIPAHTFRQNRNIMRTVCWFSRIEYVMQAIADSLWCIGSFIEYIC